MPHYNYRVTIAKESYSITIAEESYNSITALDYVRIDRYINKILDTSKIFYGTQYIDAITLWMKANDPYNESVRLAPCKGMWVYNYTLPLCHDV